MAYEIENWKNLITLNTMTSWQNNYFYLRPLFGTVKANIADISYSDKTSLMSMPLWSAHANGFQTGTLKDAVMGWFFIKVSDINDQEKYN